MNCKNCGNMLNGQTQCPYCGTVNAPEMPMNNMPQPGMQLPMGQPQMPMQQMGGQPMMGVPMSQPGMQPQPMGQPMGQPGMQNMQYNQFGAVQGQESLSAFHIVWLVICGLFVFSFIQGLVEEFDIMTLGLCGLTIATMFFLIQKKKIGITLNIVLCVFLILGGGALVIGGLALLTMSGDITFMSEFVSEMSGMSSMMDFIGIIFAALGALMIGLAVASIKYYGKRKNLFT